jgi:apolipoprotein N-acyltransferase
MRVHAYRRWQRVASGVLVFLSRFALVYLAVRVAIDIVRTEPTPLLLVIAALLLLVLLPWLVARLLRHGARARLHCNPGLWVLEHKRERIEVPRASIVALRPWAWPVPETGLDVELDTGRILRLGVPTPSELEPWVTHDALWTRVGSDLWMQFAMARSARPGRRLAHWSFKYVVWPSLLAVVLFRAYQYILFGGPLGQYHLFGLGPYLATFARTWLDVATHLVLLAALVRTLVELCAWGLTRVRPGRRRGIRRATELVASAVYYFGAAAVCLGPFLA